jgi:hypothetical protein
MSRHTRKNFLHRYRNRFTQRGGKASRAPKPPRAPKARKPPKPPKASKSSKTAKTAKTAKARKPQQAANPASKRSQKKAAAQRKKSETPKQKADRAAAAKKAGKEKFAASGSVRKTKKEKKANKAAAKTKKKKNSADAAAKKKKADADAAAAKKKKADADAAAKKKKKDDGKSSMLPPMLSSGLGALGSLAGKVGDALVNALDDLKDMMTGLGDGPFGSGLEGGPGSGDADGALGSADKDGLEGQSGDFSGSADSSCTPAQQAKKNEADALRSKSLETYPTNPKIYLIHKADLAWKKAIDSAKPPIVGNCEPREASEKKEEEKEPTDATVPKTVTDEEFLESWRQFEVIIEIKPITDKTSYTTIKQAIDRALYKAKVDQDKSAIYAASRVILDPINTRRYLDILKKQALEK